MKHLLWKIGSGLAFVAGTASAYAGTPPVPPPAAVAPAREPVLVYTDARPLLPEQAQGLFKQMTGQTHIAFKYAYDGCYARAHLMVQRLRQAGIDAGKVWSMADSRNPDDNLHVSTANDPHGFVEWGWHVAATVPVLYPAGVYRMVIDPSLFDRPVTVAEWLDVQKKHWYSKPAYCLTRPGEAPTLPNGKRATGGGYWIDSTGKLGEPPADLDAFSLGVMKVYKQKETEPTVESLTQQLKDLERLLREHVSAAGTVPVPVPPPAGKRAG